ncbi:hypothetical protein E2C01_061243 [Portunus trituberculatus]|uniref:Uncharacterized protein n=1 Tax=Portunus trituberculatus TaxID=210409 RepID=A0A5B7HDV3_PORTR|nr:hypothetical protein [Portunus trituberculatus]
MSLLPPTPCPPARAPSSPWVVAAGGWKGRVVVGVVAGCGGGGGGRAGRAGCLYSLRGALAVRDM